MNDLYASIRFLRKRPGFSVVAILTMALGIGTATAAFTILDQILLRPLPYAAADRLVSVWSTVPAWRTDPIFEKIWDHFTLSYGQYEQLRRRSSTFEEIAIFKNQTASIVVGNEPRRIVLGKAPYSFFTLLGLQPFRGRLFTAEDESQLQQILVITHKMWLGDYGGDPDVIGRTVVVETNGMPIPYTIVGILPANFEFPLYDDDVKPPADAWVPLNSHEAGFDANNPDFEMIGHLRPGVAILSAEAETKQIIAASSPFPPELAQAAGSQGVRIIRRQDQETRIARMPVMLSFAGAAVLLLIGCCNVANLLLGESARRQYEMAMRSALGAGRGRIIRQLTTEGLVLSFVGAVLGAALGFVVIHGLLWIIPQNVPNLDHIHLDLRGLGFAVAVSMLTGVCFGIIPAFAGGRSDLNLMLKRTDSSRGSRGATIQRFILVIECSLSFLLLVSAALLVQSLFHVDAMRPSILSEKLLSVQMASLSSVRYNSPSRIQNFYSDLTSRLASIRGVEAVTAVSMGPFGGERMVVIVRVEGLEFSAGAPQPIFEVRQILPNYFAVLGVPLLDGRSFTTSENARKSHVVIVNKALAAKLWPNGITIGKRIYFDNQPSSIVGVVEDLRELDLRRDPVPTIYVPAADVPKMTFIVKATADSIALGADVRAQIRALDSTLPIIRIDTLDNLISLSTSSERYRAILITLLAIAAATLTALGLYGVVSRWVVHRSHELALRVALGAKPGNVLWLVLRQTIFLSSTGVIIGIVAARTFGSVLASLLFGVSALDVPTYAAIALGLIGVSVVAACIPGRRAARMDPSTVFRAQ